MVEMIGKRTFWASAAFAFALVGAEAAGIPGHVEWGKIVFTDGSSQFVSNVVDATGAAACLAQEDLSPVDAQALPSSLHFLRALDGSQTLVVDGISLDVANNFSVTAVSGLSLKAVGARSLVEACQFGESGDDVCTFENLAFVGANLSSADFLPYDGGAIKIDGGRIVLRGCSFSNFATRFSGGAVSAFHLKGESLVTNCTFTANRAQSVNGYGGALYASAASDASDATLKICDSRFTGNVAENGGALCALPVVDDNEAPLDLAICDNTLFSENVAVYEGGALIAGGTVSADGFNTVFRANRAGLGGGAICVTGIADEIPLPCAIRLDGVTFADNAAETNTTWTAGGAVAVMAAGCELSVCGHVTFTNNVSTTGNGDEPAFGGAVYAATGVTNSFVKVLFVDNRSENNGSATSYGGAISADPGSVTVDTCVFDCGVANSASCYGSAIDLNKGCAVLRNATFRRGKAEAVSAYRTALAVTNCVIVGNGLEEGYTDLFLQEVSLSMAYSAYGTINSSHPKSSVITNTLSARQASDVYDGDTLKLRATGFNPVAGLGLEQSATDFDGVAYGSKSYGSSMGAYETPTERLIVVVDGSRDYDGTTSSNGCLWTWNSYTNSVKAESEYAWTDLAPAGGLSSVFEVTKWNFGNAAVGQYSSLNSGLSTITATVGSKTEKAEWMRRIVNFIYTGTISECGDVKVYLDPIDYVWTGEAVTPGDGTHGTLVVTNEVDGKILGRDEYRCDWYGNVNPSGNKTGGIPQAMLVVTCTNNYNSVVTNWFAISAYVTKYSLDGEPDAVVTNGALSGTHVAAVPRERDGYCIDWQNSVTNMEVYLYGSVPESETVTTLKMLYETDTNGDSVPDKYQRKVLFATVNGYWDGTANGSDIVKWVTLTNTTPHSSGGGTWSADGVCTLTDEVIPSVGNQPFYRFAKTGVWNQTPSGSVVTSSSFPMYFYSPDSSSGPSRTGRESLLSSSSLSAAALSGTTVNVEGLKNSLSITDFAFDSEDGMAGAVEAQVLNTLDDSALCTAPLDNAQIEIWGASEIGGEWFKVCDVTTDADGFWSVSRIRQSRTPSTTIENAGSRSSEVSVSCAATPKFFKVKLSGE